MKLLAVCLMVAAPMAVVGFGGATEAVKCHTCACDKSFGDILDPLNNRKCCSPALWDGFCDTLTETTCEKECANHDHSKDEEDWLISYKTSSARATSLGQQGDFCGTMYSGNKKCAEQFHCHSKDENEDPEDGVCMPFHEVGADLVDEIPYLGNFTVIPTGRDADFQFSVQHNSDVQKTQEELLADLARSMEVDQSRLYFVNAPGRRQYGQYPYSSYGRYTVGVQGAPGQSTCTPRTTPSSTALQWAQKLKAANVKLLNFDWDLTANNKHTYQGTYSSYEQINCDMSKDFIDIALAYCQENIPVAIVTYNDAYLSVGGSMVNGKQMIEKVLKMAFPQNSKCANMKVYARNDHNKGTGKNWHLQNSQAAHGYPSNGQTMLVDDTRSNIDLARPRGYQTVWVNPAKGFTFSNMQYNWSK